MNFLRRPRRRGYLLLEAAVAGALLSVVLASTLSLLAQARVQGSYAARRASAISLARAKMDEFVGVPTIVATSQSIIDVDPVDFPGIKWKWAVTDVSSTYASASPNGIGDVALFEIVVIVLYPTATGTSTFTLKQLRAR